MDRWAFNSSIRGLRSAGSCTSGPCSALCEGGPAGGRAARPRPAFNCATLPREPGCVVGLPLISCACPRLEMSREGVPLVVIQRQLGHANLGVTSVCLRGIDNAEVIQTVRDRPAPPVISASNAVRIDA